MSEREATFRRWMKEYGGIVGKVSRVYAPRAVDREDLTQEVLLQLWRSIESYRGTARESTWVYRVALNTAMTWQRRARTQLRIGAPPDDLPCTRPQPDASASNRERVDWLYEQIAALPKLDRSLVLLYLDGVAYRETAEILGISESNVGVKINRLKKRLATRAEGVDHGP
ncbi:MAG: sigma-70 family RNA polymerase sigma factor [bacterium]|nr:sigma-70 family RNA polymerase sigma factor [bacterium]